MRLVGTRHLFNKPQLSRLFRTLVKMIKLAIKSKKIRKKFGLIDKAKRKLINNRKNTKYIGYILCLGEK